LNQTDAALAVNTRTDDFLMYFCHQQVCAELFSSALDMPGYPHLLLSAGAAPAVRLISLLPAWRSAAYPARRCCCRSMRQTDRQTDGWTPNRYIDPASHAMRAPSIKHSSPDATKAVVDIRGPIYKISYDNLTIILR